MLGKNLIQAAAGAGAAGEVLGIEDVFSTWLYTGTGSTQTITNGIDLAGEGGMIFLGHRAGTSSGNLDRAIHDTERGPAYAIYPSTTNGNVEDTGRVTSFNSDGFSLASNNSRYNESGYTYASWTFRKAEKFFDVVTWTGDGVSGRSVAHNLGSVPGCIIVKSTSAVTDWMVWHRTGINQGVGCLNLADSFAARSTVTNWFTSSPTSTEFTVSSDSFVNANGGTYVAYLFAHDAGGFGDDGTESVIKCGSYTGTGSTTNFIDLGFEPQFVLVKCSSNSATDWLMTDAMRGMSVGGNDAIIKAHLSNSEIQTDNRIDYAPTGFFAGVGGNDNNASGRTYIYIAIRRGPMKTPTDATEVFDVKASPAGGSAAFTGFPIDMQLRNYRIGDTYNTHVNDRVRGVSSTGTIFTNTLHTASTSAEDSNGYTVKWTNTGFNVGNVDSAYFSFRRAPGFFDVVAYTGTNSARSVIHGLGVTPELVILKSRNNTYKWYVGSPSLGLGPEGYYHLVLNTTASKFGDYGQFTSFAASTFSLSSYAGSNGGGTNYIAYLFGTVAGVSKVGSYTGTGTTLQVNCGFAAGARFVLIKRTDSTGDWYVWDTARGIVSGNDPYLLINSTAAETTSTDYIDPYSAGFEISSTAPAAINASGGSFIFLAIA
jgi:hypothetical protein